MLPDRSSYGVEGGMIDIKENLKGNFLVPVYCAVLTPVDAELIHRIYLVDVHVGFCLEVHVGFCPDVFHLRSFSLHIFQPVLPSLSTLVGLNWMFLVHRKDGEL